MYFKTFYWNLLAPFASLYAFFLIRFMLVFYRKKTKYHLKLVLLALCSFTMATISGVMLSHNNPYNMHVFTFASVANYSAFYIYFNLITRRFGYRDSISKFLETSLGFVALCVFIALVVGIVGDPTWIYQEGEKLPKNLFLANTIGSYRLSFFPKLISVFGTLAVTCSNLYLLQRFFRHRLAGYQKLIWWGVIASLLVKVNDFILTSGLGTYLIPLGFINFLFEIIYFHFEYEKGVE